MSLRFGRSTTLRFAALVFVLQLLGGGAVLYTVRELTRTQILADAEDYAERLRDECLDAYRRDGLAGLKKAAEQRSDPARLPRSVILLVDRQGRYLAGNLADWPPTLTDPNAECTIDLYRIGRESSERMRIIAAPLPGGERLLTGHVIEGELHVASAMEEAMLTAFAIAVALAAVAALVAAAIIERRLRATVATAQAVAAGSLDRRVPVNGAGDAFEELAQSINAMLDRIAMLMTELKIATDGLAHDLRSPLSRLRVTLERAMTGDDLESTRSAVTRALEESDRLLAMLDTALRITRAEAGLGREAFVDTDISALLEDMAEVYGPLAEDGGHSIRSAAAPGIRAFVHRELLGQAIANLIDNALKYGAGEIGLNAVRDADRLVIEVSDRGIGIKEDRRAEALKRFGRLDPARSERGAGLGLSLAAAVAHLHGGSLDLGDNDPGLVVRLTLAITGGSGGTRE